MMYMKGETRNEVDKLFWRRKGLRKEDNQFRSIKKSSADYLKLVIRKRRSRTQFIFISKEAKTHFSQLSISFVENERESLSSSRHKAKNMCVVSCHVPSSYGLFGEYQKIYVKSWKEFYFSLILSRKD